MKGGEWVTNESELFEDTYSPSLVRFWLAHWDDLETLAGTEGDTTRVRDARGHLHPIGRGWVSLDGVEWAGGPSRNADLADHLQREYALIQYYWFDRVTPHRLTPDERRKYCLCGRTEEWTQGERASGGVGEPGGRARRLVADLEDAADQALPVRWAVTELVYRQQNRYALSYRTRLYRYRQNLEVRPVDGMPERGYGVALALMARHLGWKSERSLDEAA